MINIFLGFILGILFFVGFGAWRALRSDGWDDSNLLNWLRLLSQVFIHPEDFVRMYYVYGMGLIDDSRIERAFPYLGKDEFEGVVKSRPKE